MKTTFILSILMSSMISLGATSPDLSSKSYSFQFKLPKNKALTITQTAISKEQAYKMAANECFNKLTGGNYPGEEKGLEIIDICANPKM